MFEGLNKVSEGGHLSGEAKGAIRGESQGDYGMSSENINGFNPLIYGDMWGWWRSDYGLTLVRNTNGFFQITNWNSIVKEPSANAYSAFRQTTTAQAPIYVPSGIPYLQFRSSVSQWLTNDQVPRIEVDCHILIVASYAIPIDATSRYLIGSRSSTENSIRNQLTSGTKKEIILSGGSTTNVQGNMVHDEVGKIKVFSKMNTNDGLSHYRTNLNIKTSLPYASNATSGINLCSRFTGPSQTGSYDVYEILAWKTGLTDEQYQRVYSYLAAKYKIRY